MGKAREGVLGGKVGRIQAALGSRAGIDREASHIRTTMEEVLDEHAKKRRACARSKVWWSQEIADLRSARGQAKRKRHQKPAAFREVKWTVRWTVRRAKNEC